MASVLDCVSIQMVHSPDDGGWYGEVFRHEPGRPGSHYATEVSTYAKAHREAMAFADEEYPGVDRVTLADIK